MFLDLTDGALDAEITLTRSASAGATVVGSTGTVSTQGTADTPRFSYFLSASTFVVGLLLEEARTNYLTYSSDLSNAAWTKYGTTATAAALTLNGISFSRLTAGTSNGQHGALNAGSSLTTGYNTLSADLVANGYRYVYVQIWSNATFSGGTFGDGFSKGAIVDLQTGTIVATNSGITATIESLGSGIYRVSVSATLSGSSQLRIDILNSSANSSGYPSTTSWVGDGSSGIYVANAQSELGGGVSSRIPTTSATVTRAVERAWLRPASIGSAISNGAFASDTVWTKGSNWTISGGVASCANSGSASSLSQAPTITTGDLYRVTFTISAYTSGSVTPRFTGGTTVTGTARSAAGTYTEFLTPLTGNTAFEMLGDSTFQGSIDNVEVERVGSNFTYAVEYQLPTIDSSRASHVLDLNDESTNNAVRVIVGTSGAVTAEMMGGGVVLHTLSLGTYTAGSVDRVSVAWGYTGGAYYFKASRNGGTVQSAVPSGLFTPSRVDLMNRYDGARAANGHIRWLLASTHVASDSDLQNPGPVSVSVDPNSYPPSGQAVAVIEATVIAVGANDNAPVGQTVGIIEETILPVGTAAQPPIGQSIAVVEATLIAIGRSEATPHGRSIRLVHTPVTLIDVETPSTRRGAVTQGSRRGTA